MMKQNLTKEELELALQELDNKLELQGKKIQEQYDIQDDLWEERDKIQKSLDELLFKDYLVEVNSCYMIHNENPSWHDKIYDIIKILDYKNNFIKYVNYIYRTDDGDERLIIEVKTNNKVSFLRDLRQYNFETVNINKVQEILKEYLYLE